MMQYTLLSRNVLLLALTAICLGGCRDSGTSLTNFWRRQPRDVASSTEPSDRKTTDKNVDVKLEFARSAEKQGRSDRAVKLYLDAVDSGYDGADAYHRLAVLHDKRGKHSESAEFYKQALRRAPDNAEVLCDYGYSLYLQQRWAEAENNLRQAVDQRPEFARAHNNLGLLLGRTGRHHDSLMEFVRAGAGEADARANLGFAMLLEQQWSGAQEQFELALSADSSCQRASQGLNALQAVNPQQVAVDPEPSDSGWAVVGSGDARPDGHVSLPMPPSWQ